MCAVGAPGGRLSVYREPHRAELQDVARREFSASEVPSGHHSEARRSVVCEIQSHWQRWSVIWVALISSPRRSSIRVRCERRFVLPWISSGAPPMFSRLRVGGCFPLHPIPAVGLAGSSVADSPAYGFPSSQIVHVGIMGAP